MKLTSKIVKKAWIIRKATASELNCKVSLVSWKICLEMATPSKTVELFYVDSKENCPGAVSTERTNDNQKSIIVELPARLNAVISNDVSDYDSIATINSSVTIYFGNFIEANIYVVDGEMFFSYYNNETFSVKVA